MKNGKGPQNKGRVVALPFLFGLESRCQPPDAPGFSPGTRHHFMTPVKTVSGLRLRFFEWVGV